MTLSAAAEKVLRDILAVGAEREVALGRRLRVPTPGPSDLYEFCETLAVSPGEEILQCFLAQRPGFLTGLLGGPDNTDLAVLLKPPVGTRYKADFCVLQAHQGGAIAHLVEIESSHERLFTKTGRVAKRLADAITQIEDWRIWISRAKQHYARELLDQAKSLPLLADYSLGERGFRLDSPENVEQHWKAFGGLDDPFFSFTILIGRWSQLTSQEKARLLNRNRESEQTLRIFTYEQVARGANYRLERDDWFNDYDEWGALDQPIQPID